MAYNCRYQCSLTLSSLANTTCYILGRKWVNVLNLMMKVGSHLSSPLITHSRKMYNVWLAQMYSNLQEMCSLLQYENFCMGLASGYDSQPKGKSCGSIEVYYWRTYLNYWIVILLVIRCNIIKREETACSLIGLPTHFLSVMAKWISSHLVSNQAQLLGWAPDSTATWVCTLGVWWLWLNDQSRLPQIK